MASLARDDRRACAWTQRPSACPACIGDSAYERGDGDGVCASRDGRAWTAPQGKTRIPHLLAARLPSREHRAWRLPARPRRCDLIAATTPRCARGRRSPSSCASTRRQERRMGARTPRRRANVIARDTPSGYSARPAKGAPPRARAAARAIAVVEAVARITRPLGYGARPSLGSRDLSATARRGRPTACTCRRSRHRSGGGGRRSD
jgi:hypothetical protein